MQHRGSILADEMGLGKTVQVTLSKENPQMYVLYIYVWPMKWA